MIRFPAMSLIGLAWAIFLPLNVLLTLYKVLRSLFPAASSASVARSLVFPGTLLHLLVYEGGSISFESCSVFSKLLMIRT